jgi:predicted nucleic acid-binding protein
MIALDAGVLSLMIYPKSAVPKDFKTGLDIEHARERIDALIKKIESESESIVIATPALSEALVVVAPDVQRHVTELESQSCFKIRSFDKRAAIEIALRVKRAKEAGDKKEGVPAAWDKIKYDHQIVAVAKVEGVSEIVSMDKDIHQHGALWGISVRNVSQLPVPHIQGKFKFDKKDSPDDTTKK